MKYVHKIKIVINATIDSFVYVALLLILLIFIYSLIGMNIYGGRIHLADNPFR